MVYHFARQGAVITAVAIFFFDGQLSVAFPGNAYTIMKTFNTKRLASFKKTLPIAGDHFVKGEQIALAVDFNQITLEALTAFMEGDDQRVMALF